VKVWDAQTGQEQLTFQGHADVVTSVCFSPDGTRLASASGNKLSSKSGAVLSLDLLNKLGLSGDKSSGKPGEVKVWDAKTGEEVLTLKGHTASVNGVCFSPDGWRLATASDDRTVKVWNATPKRATGPSEAGPGKH
jgi:WD40 repeat protein